MQERGASVFLGGPPLVKMAIDEDVDEEALGGAEMHSPGVGLSDYLAVDERDAIRLGREIVGAAQLAQAGASVRARPSRRAATTPTSCSA